MNPAELYPLPLQTLANLVLASVEPNCANIQNNQSYCETFVDFNSRLISEIVKQLTAMLQKPHYQYITKVFMTLCMPPKLLNSLHLFSIEHKLDFHVETSFTSYREGATKQKHSKFNRMVNL